jgi:hypothetical protein
VLVYEIGVEDFVTVLRLQKLYQSNNHTVQVRQTQKHRESDEKMYENKFREAYSTVFMKKGKKRIVARRVLSKSGK